jgi:hypothetical protein
MTANLQSKFLRVLNPSETPLTVRLRRKIAGWISPETKFDSMKAFEYYFTHKYLIGVHEHYTRESQKLNKAISKLQKKNRELQKKLNALPDKEPNV